MVTTGVASLAYLTTAGPSMKAINSVAFSVSIESQGMAISGYRVDRADSRTRRIASKLYNFMILLFFRIRLKDVDCAFKLLKREVVQASGRYINNGAFICAELFFRAKRQGYKIKQVPVHHYSREYGKSTSFSLFFILRSIVELAETLWYLDWRDKFYAFRRDLQRRLLLKRRSTH